MSKIYMTFTCYQAELIRKRSEVLHDISPSPLQTKKSQQINTVSSTN